MEVKCPVAGCNYTVHSIRDGYEHFQNYDDFHKQLHYNWLNYFFKDIAQRTDWDDVRKFRVAYWRWHAQEKKRMKMMQKQREMKMKANNNIKTTTTTLKNITVKDGKVIADGKEYTIEEFSKIMRWIEIKR